MSTPPPLPPPYRAEALVGEGATGDVWRAQDRARGVPVAVKVVHRNLAMLPRFRARFAREVSISASVVHPRVVPVLDRGRLKDGRPFVVLALAERGSLEDLFQRKPPLSVGVRILDHVLEALAALHARGIVHQDLKPGNVLLHGDPDRPDAWVADLGAAGALTELAMDRRGIAGTPAWMAPEQRGGRAQELGPWTDLYPVGLMLAEMLGARRLDLTPGAGPPPFPVALPEDTPRMLAGLVRILLDRDPRQRYDRAADARLALAEAARELDPERSLSDANASLFQRTTTFPEWLLEDAKAHVAVGQPVALGPGRVPVWNREPPPPMPRSPPPIQPAWVQGADVGLFALRDPPLAVRDEVRRQLWLRARYVVASQAPQVVLVVGRTGSGKSRLVDHVARGLDEGGWMEVVALRYHAPAETDDGYRGAVQRILNPWNDTREEAGRVAQGQREGLRFAACLTASGGRVTVGLPAAAPAGLAIVAADRPDPDGLPVALADPILGRLVTVRASEPVEAAAAFSGATTEAVLGVVRGHPGARLSDGEIVVPVPDAHDPEALRRALEDALALARSIRLG